MALHKYRLGELITLIERRNSSGEYGLDDVRGVNNLKEMIRTKADVSARDLTKFQIVKPNEFFFNHRTSRNGSKFSITYNYDEVSRIVTEDYVLFDVSRDDALDSVWLYLYFCRSEFDRYVIQNSWGSSTEFYNWEDLCDVEIELPSLDVQRKYVAVYEAMLKDQQAYECGLDDLKTSYEVALKAICKSAKYERIGSYIEKVDVRNSDNSFVANKVMGLSINKTLIPTKANLRGVSLSNYKIISKYDLVYVPVTSRNGEKISIALNDRDESFITSSINTVFRVKTDSIQQLLPEYLMLFFNRSEFDRYARFNSWGSARETFDWSSMLDVTIPLPSLQVQQSIVNLYKAYTLRSEINERLKSQLKDICPVLIKGSIEEASR
ncbi:type I restriction endonuclease subunit S [Bifidobacterium myosotis]|uniref:Type I restriction endonuclease subunit S n=1 Tax=Bifidobacterium myosotis TaxID=1630166 RepID=A0A261FMC6_9BIFI|nr:restriction endonuclease subunit S [Bifidobacterium myosotis]OZG60342.1 type I restriction endonuclease subunit S [Bifidobacterium myosotis]